MIIQEMTRGECLATLARARVGRLACAHENQPYVVPISFVYHEPFLYGFTTPGQKVEWLRANPLACVEVDEVDRDDRWTSVLVFGHYEELPGEVGAHPGREPWRPEGHPAWSGSRERDPVPLRVFELLQPHAGWWQPGVASGTLRSPGRPLAPVFYRIRIDRVTGRRATPAATVPTASAPSSPPARAPVDWLRRVFRAASRPFVGTRNSRTHTRRSSRTAPGDPVGYYSCRTVYAVVTSGVE
jgi:nitroimidazol reductase NimA-like FMN-containing flavoprotein (pyridoxamine 5'-phosphate oxidase superfamily)